MGRCIRIIKELAVWIVRARDATAFLGLLLSPKRGRLKSCFLQISSGNTKPVERSAAAAADVQVAAGVVWVEDQQ